MLLWGRYSGTVEILTLKRDIAGTVESGCETSGSNPPPVSSIVRSRSAWIARKNRSRLDATSSGVTHEVSTPATVTRPARMRKSPAQIVAPCRNCLFLSDGKAVWVE